MLRSPSEENMSKSRLPMMRFILQGNLCILDYDKASELAIKKLQEDKSLTESKSFPDQILMQYLCELDKPVAYPLPKPESLKEIKDINGFTITDSSNDINGLRGWSRFLVNETADNAQRKHVEIYKRWWNRRGGHIHPMLLWLQRDYVFKEFEEKPALAGMDEETPYDFDHILPSAHWAYWTGVKVNEKFIDYPLKDGVNTQDNTGSGYIGNGIGNIHVLESSVNRSLGDLSASKKLERAEFMQNAHIYENEECWLNASGKEDAPRTWSKDRALAFQRAVEQRTFSLYMEFYKALCPNEAGYCP